jgi:hypothetical protein
MAEVTSTLPALPFDGQEFIDSFRIKWIFEAASDCWRRVGTVPNLPVANEAQSGLLSARLKQLLDSIPERGGHFGIVSSPLLTLANSATALLGGTVKSAFKNESGSQITVVTDQPMVVDQYAGKGILFKSGLNQGKLYLVFTNSATDLFLDGDATAAKLNDTFIIINPADLNPNGILLGDIMLVSDSVDISCIDANGIGIAQADETTCGEKPQADRPDGRTPGFDFKISKDFIEQFCIVIPGCKGPIGARGDKGLPGKDGTGDGPTGETGDAGADASETPNTFTGIKVVDVNDVYDMAVVGIELDAANNRLNLIKAKVRTPNGDTPAEQVIASPVTRYVNFTDESTFAFGITMPDNDPIGTPDVDILRYPEGYEIAAAGTQSQAVQPQRVKLSALIDEIANYWDDQLRTINDKYNKDLKAYIEAKDAAARTILANMAQEVAECEFKMPIEFCLGIHPDECHAPATTNNSSGPSGFNFPLATSIFGQDFKTQTGTPGTPTTPNTPSTPTAFDLGTYEIVPTAGDDASSGIVHVKWPDALSPIATTTLPAAGYVIQYVGGSVKSSETDWLVGDPATNVGLEAQVVSTSGTSSARKMPVPTQIFNPKEKKSVEAAYKNAPIFEKIISLTLDAPGSINIKACLPGVDAQGAISVKVMAVFNGEAPPAG